MLFWVVLREAETADALVLGLHLLESFILNRFSSESLDDVFVEALKITINLLELQDTNLNLVLSFGILSLLGLLKDDLELIEVLWLLIDIESNLMISNYNHSVWNRTDLELLNIVEVVGHDRASLVNRAYETLTNTLLN